MRKSDSVLLRVFLCGLPLAGGFAVFCRFYGMERVDRNVYLTVINGIDGLVFALCMLICIYFSIRLIVSGPFRDRTLARLACMRERDEREAMITGRATKFAFLSSLAILILLFCLSCFHVSVYRVPPEKAVGGKTGVVALGAGFDFFEHSGTDKAVDSGRKNLFVYEGLPLSTPVVILILIMWQVVAFNYSARRLAK